MRGRLQYGPLFGSAPLWQHPLQWEYYSAQRMRGIRQVPVDHGIPVEEHARASAVGTPPLLHRGDIGDVLELQEQLQRGRDWYSESQDFGRDSSSEYKTPGILRDLPTRSANNTPERHDFSRDRREHISPPDRKRRRVEEVHRRSPAGDFERAPRREPDRRSRELPQPGFVETRADEHYGADDEGDEWTLVTGRRRRARLLANKPGHSRVDFQRRPRSPAPLPRIVRDVVDISSGSESEHDDRRRQAVSAGRHRGARQRRRESPPSVYSTSTPERASSGGSPVKPIAVKHLRTWGLKFAGNEKEDPQEFLAGLRDCMESFDIPEFDIIRAVSRCLRPRGLVRRFEAKDAG